MAAVLLVCVALCLCLWAMYVTLSVYWGMGGAAFLVASLILLLAGLMAWTAAQVSR